MGLSGKYGSKGINNGRDLLTYKLAKIAKCRLM
jgi:hypothetical protein